MEIKSAKVLLEKYREGTCTKIERSLVEKWYATWNEDDEGKLFEKQLNEAAERIYSKFNFILQK